MSDFTYPFQETSLDTIAPAIEQLHATFNSGITKPIQWRIQQLQAFRQKLTQPEQLEALCLALFQDLGKSRSESLICELNLVVAEIDEAISLLEKHSNLRTYVDTNIVNEPAASFVYNEPLGVVCIAAPWNYPINLLFLPLVGAIAGGNCVVLRPGSFSAHCSEAIAAFIASVFDPSYVVVFKGEKTVTQTMLEHGDFDLIFFTGGPRLGKIYHEASVRNCTPIVLELGGCSPCFVLKDTDLATAANRVTWGAFLNAGQTCVRPNTLYIDEECTDEFVTEMKRAINAFYRQGDDEKEYRVVQNQRENSTAIPPPQLTQQQQTQSKNKQQYSQNDLPYLLQQGKLQDIDNLAQHLFDSAAAAATTTSASTESAAAPTVVHNQFVRHSPFFGRIITPAAFERLSALLDADAQYIVVGGDRDQATKYIEPTILVFPDVQTYKQSALCTGGEIFGPILPIVKCSPQTVAAPAAGNGRKQTGYPVIDTYINNIQRRDKPLALYAFTNDEKIKESILTSISCGGVSFNDTILHLVNPSLPFGGVGSSGMGVYHGKWSFETFTHKKAVLDKSIHLDAKLRYPPYTKSTQKATSMVQLPSTGVAVAAACGSFVLQLLWATGRIGQ